MNCANHADASAVAFCRTCGKPLCANCTRDVRGVIYCENCLAARMEFAMPATPAAVVPPASGAAPVGAAPLPNTVRPVTPYASSGPNPTVAGILAGFFPFGVGAVYTSQYAKGLAHLLIFTFLVWGHSEVNSAGLHTLLGLSMGFFYFYQIIDAVRSARALQLGQPVPDPLGLAQSFGGGERLDTSKIPAGAVVLIILGVLFLAHTMGFFEFGFNRYWPLILIAFGGYLLVRKFGLIGGTPPDCDRCRTRHLMGPAMMVTIGMLFLLENTGVAYFDRTWPVILLVIGLVKLVQTNASTEGHRGPPTGLPPTGAVPAATSPVPPPPPSEVNNG
jgi:hypothetical protein